MLERLYPPVWLNCHFKWIFCLFHISYIFLLLLITYVCFIYSCINIIIQSIIIVIVFDVCPFVDLRIQLCCFSHLLIYSFTHCMYLYKVKLIFMLVHKIINYKTFINIDNIMLSPNTITHLLINSVLLYVLN